MPGASRAAAPHETEEPSLPTTDIATAPGPLRRTRRRTQAERSHATRSKILQETLDCLLEKGLRETSTVVIARRAGVSRGALLHHFPTKEELLKEALHFQLRAEIEQILEMAHALEAGTVDFDGFLATLWEHFSGPLFMITLEYLTAARTDPAIKGALVPPALEFNQALDAIWERLMLGSHRLPHERRLALNVTLCFLRGMGTQSVWRDDPRLFEDMLAFWKQTLRDAGLVEPAKAAPGPRARRAG